MSSFEAQPRIEPLRIAVVSGGSSAEREISLASGQAVAKALSERGHHVSKIDPREFDLQTYSWENIDVAFLALHGEFGEDGQAQQILDDLGIPYTGSTAEASRLAFSKSASKERFIQYGTPTPSYLLIHESDSADRIQKHVESLGYPLVIKPDTQGSSLGVNIVQTPEELPRALSQCFHYDSFGVLETFVAGSEWTLGVVDNQPLPLIEIETENAFFNFEAKYQDESTGYRFDFDLPSNVIQLIEKTGLRACEALGTTGLVRVDIRLDKFNQPWVLEVNTIPGLTDHSLVPKAAAKMGLNLGELCEKTLLGSLKSVPQHPHKQ